MPISKPPQAAAATPAAAANPKQSLAGRLASRKDKLGAVAVAKPGAAGQTKVAVVQASLAPAAAAAPEGVQAQEASAKKAKAGKGSAVPMVGAEEVKEEKAARKPSAKSRVKFFYDAEKAKLKGKLDIWNKASCPDVIECCAFVGCPDLVPAGEQHLCMQF